MKYFITFLIPVLSFASPLVDFGMKAQRGDYPSVAKISVLDPHDFFGLQELSSCTGSFISNKVMVTAAHCVHTFGKAYLTVSTPGDELGAVMKNGSDIGLKVKQAFVNPRYYPAKKTYEEALGVRQSGEYIRMTPAERLVLDQKIVKLGLEMARHDIAVIELLNNQRISSTDIAQMECRSGLRVGSQIEFPGFGRNLIPGTLNDNSKYVLLSGTNVLTKVNSGLYHSNTESSRHQINSGDSGGPLYSKGIVNRIYGISVMRVSGETSSSKESVFVSLNSQSSREFIKALSQATSATSHLRTTIGRCL